MKHFFFQGTWAKDDTCLFLGCFLYSHIPECTIYQLQMRNIKCFLHNALFSRTYENTKNTEDCWDPGQTHCCGLGISGLQHHSLPYFQCHYMLSLLLWTQREQSRLLGHGPQSTSARCGSFASLHKCQPQDDLNQPRREEGKWGDHYPDRWRWYVKCSYGNYIKVQSRQVEGNDSVCYNMYCGGWKFSSINVLISPKMAAVKVL